MVSCVSTAMDSAARVRPTPSFGFDLLFEDVDVVLKFAGEKFPDFLIDAIHIRDQRQQSQQQKQREQRRRNSCHPPRLPRSVLELARLAARFRTCV